MSRNYSRNESGRSMVEMLGVLAIIGVLSIAGIMGYTYAITKSHVNTLMDEARKRAVIVTSQINLQNQAPSLASFTINAFSGGIFENVVYGESGENQWATGDRQFTLSITDVNGSVCAKMQKSIDDSSIKVFKPDACDPENLNNIKLTYNNDLSPGDLPAQDTEEQPLTCSEGQEMCNNTCVSSCPEGISLSPRECTCTVCENGYVYLSYKSDPCQNNVTGCRNNDECDPGYFCNLTGSSTSAPNLGTCKELDSPTPKNIPGLGEVIVSTYALNWWASENYCRAQRRSMMEIDDLRCYDQGVTLVTSGYNKNEVRCYPAGDTSHVNSIVQALSDEYNLQLWTKTFANPSHTNRYMIDARSSKKWAGIDDHHRVNNYRAFCR